MNASWLTTHPARVCTILLTCSNLSMTGLCLLGAVYFAFRA